MTVRLWPPGPLGVLVLSLVLAGCGSSNTGATQARAPGGSGALVTPASSPLGTIVVSSSGRSLYAFAEDTPTTSRCTDACTQTWGPLSANGNPRYGSGIEIGIEGTLLGTITRSNGSRQVSYSGHPLYTYSGDTGAGQTNGQGFGGAWHVVSASGEVISASAPSTSTTGVR